MLQFFSVNEWQKPTSTLLRIQNLMLSEMTVKEEKGRRKVLDREEPN